MEDGEAGSARGFPPRTARRHTGRGYVPRGSAGAVRRGGARWSAACRRTRRRPPARPRGGAHHDDGALEGVVLAPVGEGASHPAEVAHLVRAVEEEDQPAPVPAGALEDLLHGLGVAAGSACSPALGRRGQGWRSGPRRSRPSASSSSATRGTWTGRRSPFPARVRARWRATVDLPPAGFGHHEPAAAGGDVGSRDAGLDQLADRAGAVATEGVPEGRFEAADLGGLIHPPGAPRGPPPAIGR